MKAILLSAGYGKRLRPITNTLPKCLVPIKKKPILEIWFENLKKAEVNYFLVNTHYLSEKVENFCKQSKFKNNIKTKYERKLLGTAGTLFENIDFYENQDGFLIHVDNYCLENLKDFIKAHHNRPKGCLMTMMIFETKFPEESGICKISKENILEDFFEKRINPPGKLANGAVYILSAELLKIIQQEFKNPVDFSTEIIPALKNKIFCYKSKNTFIDIGNLESLSKANNS